MCEKTFLKSLLLILIVAISGISARAQTNEFTYQGKLTNTGTPQATYDFEFRLCELDQSGCIQLQRKERLGVPVTNGIFTVNLDFDAAHFTGADRFLIIGVRRNSSEPWTQLSPQQKITSAPYAIKSLKADRADIAINSTELGSIPANQYVLTNDARLSDERNPLPNSGNYIQNNPLIQQPSSNFNISGTGKANIFDAATQYNINGNRILSSPAFLSLFAGIGAGAANSGSENSFFGYNAGLNNTTGFQNAFFGGQAGRNNTIGLGNAFFGNVAGISNTTGNNNAFFGLNSGTNNTTGSRNSFLGSHAGFSNTTGNNNAFFGNGAGISNSTGNDNILIGRDTDVASGDLNFAVAIGSRAIVSTSNTIVLGRSGGLDQVLMPGNVGIGTTALSFKLQVEDSSNKGLRVQTNSTGGTVASFGGNGAFEIDSPGFPGGRMRVAENGDVSIGVVSAGGNLTVYGNTLLNTVTIANGVTVNVLGAGGTTNLCRNAANLISTCSSSSRYKSNIAPFTSGLALINRLRPASFDWKADNQKDFGLVAEEVAEVEPLLVTRNEKGETEGVKYDRIGVVLINAVKEQQAQIERQQKQIDGQNEIIKKQQTQIDALKSFICANNPAAGICPPKQ